MIRISSTTAAACIALAGIAHAQSGYTTNSFVSPLSPNVTMGFGINDAGAVVGTDGANNGFLRSPAGAFTIQNVPGATQTQETGIAANGDTSGIFVDQGGTTHGFVQFPQGPATSTVVFDQPGTAFNQLLGISGDATKFAGYSSVDPAGQVLQQAYVGNVPNHTFTDINHLLPFNFNSQATGINNAGATVGFFMPTPMTSLGFEDLGGQINAIDPFGSTFTQALGISGTGEIVGVYTDANNVQHGYTDIGGQFVSVDPAGSLNTTINGVNDQGQLIGFYTNTADQVLGFIDTPQAATPVDEPTSVALLGFGLLGTVVALRRRPA